MKLVPRRKKSAAIIWWFLPVVAIGGWFYPYLGLLVIGCMFAPVIVGAMRGRHWCGWMCPRGAFFDYLMSRFTPNKPAPAWLRSKGFRIGAMVFLMGMMAVQLSLAWPNPEAMARVFVLLLGITTVAGIVLAVAYKPRTWCTFCPMGTMASWVSHGKRPLTKSAACTDCRVCAKACPMTLQPQQPDVAHVDCIKCTQCVQRCPKHALAFEDTTSHTANEHVA